MNIIDLPIKSIKPYKRNPRKNDSAVEYVANSIRQFGFKVPIVIDENYEIVCGHTRWKAAKTIGLETVPCIMADDLNEEQIKAFRLADNKTAEMAGWDFDLLEMEFNDIDPDLFDMADFGFFQDDVEERQASAEEEDRTGNMAEKYLVPPFSVLYANRQDWLARKRAWVAKGLRSEIGRGGNLAFNSKSNPEANFLHENSGGEQSKAFKNNGRLNSYMTKVKHTLTD